MKAKNKKITQHILKTPDQVKRSLKGRKASDEILRTNDIIEPETTKLDEKKIRQENKIKSNLKQKRESRMKNSDKIANILENKLMEHANRRGNIIFSSLGRHKRKTGK